MTTERDWNRILRPGRLRELRRRLRENPGETVRDVEGLLDRVEELHAALRQAEEKLRQDPVRHSLMRGALALAVAYVGGEARLRFHNEAWRDWFGLPEEALREMHLRELLGEKGYERLLPEIEASLSGEPRTFESRLERGDGEIREVRFEHLPYRRAEGRERRRPPEHGDDVSEGGYLCILSDVTEWREKERELLESNARRQAILESSVDAVIIIDEKGVIETVNPAAEQMFGYSREEMVGANVSLLMPEPYHGEHDGYLDTYRRTGRRKIIGVGREVEALRKGGEVFPVDLAVSEAVVGGRRSFLGTLRDITARKASEEALRRERDFAESLVETAPAIVLVLDSEGRIVRFNRYLEELSGFTLQEARGRDWFELFLPERERKRIRSLFRQTLRGGAVRGNVNSILTKAGQERTVEWHGQVLQDGEEPLGVLAIGLDITERRSLEDQFRQAQKMEAVGRLAGGVAHDFNTLLASIIGYCDLTLDSGEIASRQRRAVEQIRLAAERGAALTRQLLTFSRGQVLRPTLVDLNSVIVGMEDMLRRLIGEDVELQIALDPDLGDIEVDQGQLEQVIMNLVINSRDAIETGGVIEVATTKAGQPKDRRGERVRLTVIDDGAGIPEAIQSQVFEPFFTTKERGKGTGLGLSTVYGIVTQSGGEIDLDSDQGEGTTVRVDFPQVDARKPRADGPPPALEAASGGSETILLVEDDEMFLEMLSEVLRDHGYQVLAASEPREALAAAEELDGPLHLLVSDMVMPGMSGAELAGVLAAAHPRMKVLLMSGYTDEALEARGVAPRDTAFIPKPFGTRQLLGRIRDLLD